MHATHAGGMFRHADRYDRHAARLAGKLYAKIVADVSGAGLLDGARVLDAGTGPGRLPRALAAERPSWVIDAVDLEPQMIEFARGQDPAGQVTFTVGDVAALPYPDDTFDLIVSSLSQHHWADVEGGIRDLHRVLRPGGWLWIYDMRFALGRARRAADQTFAVVHQEPVVRSRWPFPLIARLSAGA